jgi:hypothetical protein
LLPENGPVGLKMQYYEQTEIMLMNGLRADGIWGTENMKTTERDDMFQNSVQCWQTVNTAVNIRLVSLLFNWQSTAFFGCV